MASDADQRYRSLYGPILKPSGEIRLVVLHPIDNPRNTISCDLVRVSLNDEIRFEALSYEWGEPGDERDIIVNNVAVPVRRNLWEALYHLREPYERRFWIDAMCINQSNKDERNQQVRQMKRIYEQSWGVLIWLGLPSADSQLALRFIAHFEHYRGHFVEWDTDCKEELTAIRHLCNRSYWNRLWIIQEVLVAKNARMQCGIDYANWDYFDKFQVAFESGEIRTRNKDKFKDLKSSSAFQLDKYQILYHNRSSSLEDLLEVFSAAKCKEIKDKIYGLAGITKDAANLPLDYSKSIFEIFTDVVMLREYQDCASMISFASFLQRVFEGGVRASAHATHPIAHESERLVGALGYCCGSINKFGPYFEDASTSVSAMIEAAAQRRLQSLLEGQTPGRKEMIKEQIKVLFQMEQQVLRETVPIHSHLSYGLRGGRGFREYMERFMDVRTAGRSPARTSCALQREEYKAVEPRFFLDNDGNVGVAPSNAWASDILCGFQGSDIIAVLRWIQDRYFLVGRALLLGRTIDRRRIETCSEMEDRISLYLNAGALQLLTQ